jgi:hypothetical protein
MNKVTVIQSLFYKPIQDQDVKYRKIERHK